MISSVVVLAELTPSNLKTGAFRFHNLILGLSRNQKKATLLISDALCVPIALWFAYVLRVAPPSADLIGDLTAVLIVTPAFAVACFWYLGLYNTLIRSMENRTMLIVATGAVLTGLFLAVLSYFDSTVWIPRSVPSIFAMLVFLMVGALRVFAKSYYAYAIGLGHNREPVLIYGAGTIGIQAASALENSDNFSVVGFIDDDPALQGSLVRGRIIYAPDKLDIVTRRYQNIRVLMAIADLSPDQKRKLIQNLDKYPIRIDSIPDYSDIVTGKAALSQIEKVRIDDLLGRETVPPDPELFTNALEGSVVLVTGAGGSIGSEICRQVLFCKPKKLVLFEQSELNLYRLEKELMNSGHQLETEIVTLLGSVNDKALISRVFETHAPEIVYHAAAYKHVPLVEANICEGVRNNIFGTRCVAQAALQHKAKRFILISTDKAVRPPNIMGATKRVAEEVVQDLATESSSTIFTMVRFGNVLGSSGSVIPLFREQIAKKQPVTVTHPEMTRYFMTIPEAAQLVIQAGFMANGREVFVLNMGEPVKIMDLARLMIQLSGLTVQEEDNPNGDIPIVISGIRPGEKLHEELLIGENDLETSHPKIFSAIEKSPEQHTLQKELGRLEQAVLTGDEDTCRGSLARIVEGYEPANGDMSRAG